MKIKISFLLLLIPAFFTARAQTDNTLIRKGNKFYHEQQYTASEAAYQKALADNPGSPVANFNLGNAAFRNGQWEQAIDAFDKTIANSNDKALVQKAYYNKGVSCSRSEKLEESIAAYEQALRLDPSDQLARENLQKALQELHKKQPPQKNDQQKKQQQQQQQQQPKMSKKRVEQLLNALLQKEKEVQQKMQQQRSRAASQPDKDW